MIKKITWVKNTLGVKKPHDGKYPCRYCGKYYKNVQKHYPNCKKKP